MYQLNGHPHKRFVWFNKGTSASMSLNPPKINGIPCLFLVQILRIYISMSIKPKFKVIVVIF